MEFVLSLFGLYSILNIFSGKLASGYKSEYIFKNLESLWKMSGFLYCDLIFLYCLEMF